MGALLVNPSPDRNPEAQISSPLGAFCADLSYHFSGKDSTTSTGIAGNGFKPIHWRIPVLLRYVQYVHLRFPNWLYV